MTDELFIITIIMDDEAYGIRWMNAVPRIGDELYIKDDSRVTITVTRVIWLRPDPQPESAQEIHIYCVPSSEIKKD